jgi:hypothetical protein
MELLLCVLFFALVFGGAQWLLRGFLEARDYTRRYLTAHPLAYRLAACLALLSGMGFALAMSLDMPLGSIFGFVVTGFVVALIALPVWFIAMLVAGFFYRTFVVPTLEVIGFLLWPLRALVGAVRDPVRRKADSLRYEYERVEREREAGTKRREQKRRENARARCEVLYHQHAPEIAKRFTRQMFDDYLRKYMGDNLEPEEVEARSEQLQSLLKGHLEKVVSPLSLKSLDEILTAFDVRIAKVRTSALDERDKEVILVELEQEREEAVRKALREGRL